MSRRDHRRQGRDDGRHGGLHGGLWRADGQDPFCSTDTGTGMAISACTAMQSMASTPSTFFSDTTGTTCTSTITANSTTDLVALFNAIAASVNSGSTGARLLSNDVS